MYMFLFLSARRTVIIHGVIAANVWLAHTKQRQMTLNFISVMAKPATNLVILQELRL